MRSRSLFFLASVLFAASSHAAVTASVSADVLNVNLSAPGDQAVVNTSGGNIDITNGSTEIASFPSATVQAINAHGIGLSA